MTRRLPRAFLLFSALCLFAVLASPGAGQERDPDARAPFQTRHGGPRMSVVARARTGVLPKSVSVSPDGATVAVCNFGRPDVEGVYLYDAATLERIAEIPFSGNAVESVWSPDGKTLFVSNFRRDVVEVIDVPTRTVRAEVATGVHPKWMSLSPDGATLYVANYGDRSISVVDVATLVELRRLPTLRHPRGMAVRNDGTLFAAAFRGDVLHVFSPGESEESERWETCQLPRHVVSSPDGTTLYLSCSLGAVAFVDARSGRRFGTTLTGRNPRTIARNGDGRWIGVANFSSSDVTLIDTTLRRHREYEIPGASGVVGLAMDPGPTPRIYVTSWNTAELIVLAARPTIAAVARPSDR